MLIKDIISRSIFRALPNPGPCICAQNKKPSLAGTGDSRGTTQISQSFGSLDANECYKISTVQFPDNAGRAAQLTH